MSESGGLDFQFKPNINKRRIIWPTIKCLTIHPIPGNGNVYKNRILFSLQTTSWTNRKCVSSTGGCGSTSSRPRTCRTPTPPSSTSTGKTSPIPTSLGSSDSLNFLRWQKPKFWEMAEIKCEIDLPTFKVKWKRFTPDSGLDTYLEVIVKGYPKL